MQNLHYAKPMDIRLFKDLERLNFTGNFSQAAALSNISQPAFSRRIKALESWVGVPVVDRSRQPVSLTEAGEQMLEAGLQALARIETERGQILEAQSLPDKYVVTFGAQHSIGWRFYPAWLQALEEAYGPILSRLRADDLPDALRDLRQGHIDFLIAYDPVGGVGGPPTEAISIGADRLVPVCRPTAEQRPMFDFRESGMQMPFLQFGLGAPIASHLEATFAKHGLHKRLRVVYENSMAGALRIRARAGDGVAWLPQSLVQPDLDSGALVRTGDDNWSVDLSIRLIRNVAHTNRITRSIWSFLKVRQTVFLGPEVGPLGQSLP